MNLKKELIIFVLFFVVFGVFSQTNERKISISFTDIPLSEAIKKIESTSKFTFFYDALKVDLKTKVSLNANELLIEKAMSQMFSNTGIKYEINNHQIALFKVEPNQNLPLKKITGIVIDEKGLPIIGASVKILGSTKGSVSDLEGKFTFTAAADSKLLVSYIGYKTVEVSASGKDFLKIEMTENAKSLDDVVVIGYGSVNRKDLTGSVASVKIPDIQLNPVASFQEALGGRIAGVQATSLSGKPGETVDIVIRGGNSVTQSNAPLYVVDGFPLTDVNGASLISPDDIESISILKDASATAIYGARGANGVVMITTKKGVRGKPTVQYNGYYGIQHTDAKINVLDPYEFVKLQLEIDPTSGMQNYLTSRTITLNDLTKRAMTLDDYKNISMVNWQDQLFRQAVIQNHFLSVSGQTDKTLYSVSASYFDQSGVIVNSGSKRYTARMNIEQRLSDMLKMGFTSSFSDGIISGSNPDSQSSNLLYTMWSTRPFLYNTESLYQRAISEHHFG